MTAPLCGAARLKQSAGVFSLASWLSPAAGIAFFWWVGLLVFFLLWEFGVGWVRCGFNAVVVCPNEGKEQKAWPSPLYIGIESALVMVRISSKNKAIEKNT